MLHCPPSSCHDRDPQLLKVSWGRPATHYGGNADHPSQHHYQGNPNANIGYGRGPPTPTGGGGRGAGGRGAPRGGSRGGGGGFAPASPQQPSDSYGYAIESVFNNQQGFNQQNPMQYLTLVAGGGRGAGGQGRGGSVRTGGGDYGNGGKQAEGVEGAGAGGGPRLGGGLGSSGGSPHSVERRGSANSSSQMGMGARGGGNSALAQVRYKAFGGQGGRGRCFCVCTCLFRMRVRLPHQTQQHCPHVRCSHPASRRVCLSLFQQRVKAGCMALVPIRGMEACHHCTIPCQELLTPAS